MPLGGRGWDVGILATALCGGQVMAAQRELAPGNHPIVSLGPEARGLRERKLTLSKCF